MAAITQTIHNFFFFKCMQRHTHTRADVISQNSKQLATLTKYGDAVVAVKLGGRSKVCRSATLAAGNQTETE